MMHDPSGMGGEEKKSKKKDSKAEEKQSSNNTPVKVDLLPPPARDGQLAPENSTDKAKRDSDAKQKIAEQSKKDSEHIMLQDIHGVTHIGPRKHIEGLVAKIKLDYNVAVGENVKGGVFGAGAYMYGVYSDGGSHEKGAKLSFAGAAVDNGISALAVSRLNPPPAKVVNANKQQASSAPTTTTAAPPKATASQPSVKVNSTPATPTQVADTKPSRTGTRIHHLAPHENKEHTHKYEAIASSYGLKLDADWNKLTMDYKYHYSKHPQEYHAFVLEKMLQAKAEAGSGPQNKEKFIELFHLYVRDAVIHNPNMVNNDGWKNK
jgi:hypothetical protein